MNLETVTIESLKLDPNNARKHSRRNLDAIAASLNKFGQRKPIVVHNGVVIAGNGTLEAAKSLGWKEIAVSVCPADWDADTAKAYALADNRSSELAEWDDKILSTQLLDLDDMGWNIEALGFEPLPLDRKQVSVWNVTKERVEGHTTPKPIEVVSNAIKNSSKPNENLLDLFGGSGSTLIAAEQTNRTCYMMELDPKYCDVIIKRWENLTGLKAELIP